MLKVLNRLADNKYYWLALMLLSLLFEAVALFYQYGLNYGPCILCIHVRIIVMLVFIVALLGLLLRQSRMGLLLINIVITGLWGWLLERSYMLLGIERRFLVGNCGFDSGLPAWFQIDQWFPFMFGIQESCGYTPVLLFGITMAEALLVMSVALLVLSIITTFNLIREKFINWQ